MIEKLDQTKAKEFIKYLKNLTKEHAQEHLDEFVQVMKDVIESKSNHFSSRLNVYTEKCQHLDSSGKRVDTHHLKDFSLQIYLLLNEGFTEDIHLELWKHFKKKVNARTPTLMLDVIMPSFVCYLLKQKFDVNARQVQCFFETMSDEKHFTTEPKP